MHKYCAFSFLLLLLSLSSLAAARTIGVPGDSPSIQAGIDSSSPGDTVLVQPGRYLETVDFKGKDIVVGSLFLATRDSSYILNTIIDADQKDTVVAFQTGETAKAELAGFTITNGSTGMFSPGHIGGGIRCINASPYLHNLIVEGNYSGIDGGGMYLQNSNSVIEFCVIRKNRAVMAGGGLYLFNGNYQIKNCSINNNEGRGAGAYISKSKVIFIRVVLFENYSSEAILASSSFVNFINCTVTNQYNDTFTIISSNVNIINSIFWNNAPEILISNDQPELPITRVVVAFSDIKNGENGIKIYSVTNDSLFWMEGNIDRDPNFKIDYSLNLTSPCIDAGIPFYQVGDSLIINLNENEYKGQAPDIGAVESDYSSTGVQSDNYSVMKFNVFPNPFNTHISIEFYLSRLSKVDLAVFSITGQKICELVSDFLLPGRHIYQWNGKDSSGNKLASGIYFLNLNEGKRCSSKRIIFLK
jgi:hypothetical protein